MNENPHYQLNHKLLPSTKHRKFNLNSNDEQLKATKYNYIEKRSPKELLKLKQSNYEINTFLGQRTDKQALLTFMNIHTGHFYSKFYDQTRVVLKIAWRN